MTSGPHRDARTLVGSLVLAVLAGSCREAPAEHAAERTLAAGGGLVLVDPQDPEAPFQVHLGHIPYGEVVRHTVELRNESADPLTIRSIQAGCSCTVPSISYTDPHSGAVVRGDLHKSGDAIRLPPAVTAELVLTVDSSLAPVKNQHKNILVRITTDSSETPYFTLEVRVFIESAFRPSPAVIDLRQVAQNGSATGEVVLLADNEEGRRILGVVSSPAGIVATLEVDHGAATEVWTLRVELLPRVPLGFREVEVLLSTSGPGGEGEGRPMAVKVRSTGVADAQIEPQTILLAAPAAGQAAEGSARLVSRLSGQAFHIQRATLLGPSADRLRVELTPERPAEDGRAPIWDVRITSSEPLGAEVMSGTLVLETDDVQHPRFEARWYYRP